MPNSLMAVVACGAILYASDTQAATIQARPLYSFADNIIHVRDGCGKGFHFRLSLRRCVPNYYFKGNKRRQ
jgi:hypothetical protein